MAPLPLRSRSSRINTENRTQTTLSKFLTRASSKLQAQQNARQQQQQQQPPQQQQQQQQQQQPRKSIIDSKSKIPENKILEGVVACLDVRTEDGDDVSQNFERALQSMGAKTRRTFSDSCTHLIFKNGSPATLKKALSKNVFIINLLWISRCKKEGRRLSEKEFIIERPQGLVLAGKKRRKSMEPSKVRALGSNDHLEPSTSSSSDASINDDLYESNQRLAEVRRKTIGIPSWKRQRMEDAGLVKRYTESFDNEESEDDIKRTTRLSLPISVEKMAAKHVIPSVNKSMPVAPSPEMKEHIKARFSFGKKVEDDTDTSKDLLPFVPLVANSTAMSTSGSTVTPLRRKRRLTGNTLPRQDNIPPSSASVVSTSTWNTSSESLPISIPKQRNVSRKPNIVFTSLTSDMRQKCKEAIESLGIYDIAAEVDERTTHVIVGTPRRTKTVAFGLLKGLWLLNPDWLLKSKEKGNYEPEGDYELLEWYPRANIARKGLSFMPSTTSIKVVSTVSGNELVEQLIKMAGGQVVNNIEDAHIIISNKPVNTKKIVVRENWIYESIEQWKYLSTDKFAI